MSEPFLCAECEAHNRELNRPPGTQYAGCIRCGEPTRQYIGAVIKGGVVHIPGSQLIELRDNGERVPDTPGVRVVAGVELYSAAWL